jgi:acyl-CoA thioesterase I
MALFFSGCKKNASPSTNTQETEPSVPSSTVSPAAAKAPADNRPVIVAFGDSLTAGYGADPGKSYPDYLQKDLDLAGYNYHVINAGISGNTTKDAVDRLQDVLALKPEVVIVAFGGNDGLRGLPLSSTRENMDQIIRALKDSGARVVLGGITLPPNYGPDYVRQFNSIYAEAAKKYSLPWIPFLLRNVYGVPGGMQEDGIHATAQGNEQVARNLMPLVKPLLKKK